MAAITPRDQLADLLAGVRAEALYGATDLESSARPAWFYRPFSSEELDRHPDRERILATIEAVVRDRLDYAFAIAVLDREGEDDDV
ncbi:MAG: hypothetical protein ACREJ5_04315 [Geminicoccaceae bacterium]